MARRFISAFVFILLVATAGAQAFGRFGYSQVVSLPGLRVDKDGFSANTSNADKIYFSSPSTIWKPVSTTEAAQVVILSGEMGNPSKANFSLLGIGFSLYFGKGIAFTIHSHGAPYLTWKDGSVAQNVATPDVKWMVLSFRDRQPPIVIGFPEASSSMIVTGKAGNWSVRSPESFKGWVRIALPSGLESTVANTAGTLGKIARVAGANEKLWTSLPPRLLKTSLAEDLYSVTATWQFDSVGAVVPVAAELAFLGGYPLEIRSKTSRLPGWTEAGPIDTLDGDSLTIRFPVKRIPTGRCLGLGKNVASPLKKAAPQDIPGVVNLALGALVAERDPLTRRAAEETISDYVSQTPYTAEPWTRQQLPFAANGTGVDLAAAHALLMQAVTITSRATSESNSLLTSVTWRRDWLTWRVWMSDDIVALRAGSLAAVAGAFCPEPERRLSAGMFQAGISGFRGLSIWKMREGLSAVKSAQLEPIFPIRKAIFGLSGAPVEGESFVTRLQSPLRVFSEPAIFLQKQGPDYSLAFPGVKGKSGVLMLATAYPIEASVHANLTSLKAIAALGFTEIHYVCAADGQCEIKLTLPPYGKLPPLAFDIPPYSEITR